MKYSMLFLGCSALLLTITLAACGGSKTAAPGSTPDFAGDRVNFAFGFYTFDGNLVASQNIYMRVLDNLQNTVYGTTVETDDKGIAHFENVPAGDFKVEFVYGKIGRCMPDIDLKALKNGNDGELAGECSF